MLYVRVILKSGKELCFSDVRFVKVGKLKLIIEHEESSYSVNLDSVANIYSEFEKL